MKKLCGIGAAAVAAAFMTSNASAVNLATDGIGEVAIAPYYTTRAGWSTLINLTNTKDLPIVVKVRVHEGKNSRDVYDFNVAMSGYDVFSGVITEEVVNGISRPVFKATDDENQFGLKTCTIPEIVATGSPRPLNVLGFAGLDANAQSNDDGGPGGAATSNTNPGDDGIDRLREGYVEFIVMGTALPSDQDGDGTAGSGAPASTAQALADAIEDHNCGAVTEAFLKTSFPQTAQKFGEPTNALKFNFRLLNVQNGTEAGNSATTWANFFNPSGADGLVVPGDNVDCTLDRGITRRSGAVDIWDPASNAAIPPVAGESCLNLVTAQQDYDFLEPSLNDAFPPVATWWDDSLNTPVGVTPDALNALGNPRGIDAMSVTILRSAIVNEWAAISEGNGNGVFTDWVVTMPTKGFYVDEGLGEQFAVTPNRPEADLGGVVPYDPYYQPFGPTSNNITTGIDEFDAAGARATAKSCNKITYALYDRAEQKPDDGGVSVPIESPAPATPQVSDQICYEANVVTFNGLSALESANMVDVEIPADFDATRGFMTLYLDEDADTGDGSVPSIFASGAEFEGLPVIGFNLKTRKLGSATKNYSSSIDHGYLRAITP